MRRVTHRYLLVCRKQSTGGWQPADTYRLSGGIKLRMTTVATLNLDPPHRCQNKLPEVRLNTECNKSENDLKLTSNTLL